MALPSLACPSPGASSRPAGPFVGHQEPEIPLTLFKALPFGQKIRHDLATEQLLPKLVL